MADRLRHVTQVMLMISLAVLPTACSSGTPTGKVQGRVTYKGIPLPEGIVLFLAEDGRQDIGSISLDGTYVVERAPVGVNQVSVQTSPPLPPAGPAMRRANEPEKKGVPTGNKGLVKSVPIPSRYANTDTSGLTFAVHEGSNKFDIELKP